MGTQEAERDWVDVANELLSKCHLNRKLRKVTDCDANVFIALYECILGEKVPDYITDPRCQEDDVHNVQSVIDSLSLDYLQISLSHITGENVVRGHKESIKNLLEIFDGLLEYLNEEISEESQNSEPNNSLNEDIQSEEPELAADSVSSSAESGNQHSSHSGHSSNVEDVGTNSDVISQEVPALAQEDDALQTSEDLPSTSAPYVPQSEVLPSAILLQPPIQSNTPYPTESDPQPAALHRPVREAGAHQAIGQIPKTLAPSGSEASSRCRSPALSERSSSRQQRTDTDLGKGALELANGGPRKVLFRTQPDVLFLTLQDETAAADASPSDTEEEEEEEESAYSRQTQQRIRKSRTDRPRRRAEEDSEQLSHRRQRNKKQEEELHNISENLSHRLEELDQMLKRVLGETGGTSELRDEDRQRSVAPEAPRSRSGSPSPPTHRGHRGEAVADSFFVNDGRQSNISIPNQTKRGRKLCQYLLDKMYQEELERYEDKERAELGRARLRALEAEREYRETLLKDAPKTHKQSPTKPKAQHRSQRRTAPPSGRRERDTHKKTQTLRVKENELLPLLVEELPHLHISTRELAQMWEEQMQQVDRLHAASSSSRKHKNLSQQLEEAQRRHNLLVKINRKDQEHGKRLREFKERIQQQKSTQSKLRDQRQQIARAKKYHHDYHVQHRARLMKARTKEERMFRQLFEEGLSIQKDRLREQREFAREQQLEHQRKQGNYIKSMENYYKDQFSLLAEKLAQERQEIQARKKAQEKALLKMKRELRSRMEREIQDLQKIIVENNEDDHFQELDIQRLRNRLHLASFNYNTSYLS